MSKMVSVPSGVRVVIVMFVLIFGWATIAHAQAGPPDQYADPAPIPPAANVANIFGDPPGDPGPTSGRTALTASLMPETGGAPLITLVAGALLVSGGLVARRVARR